MTRKARVLSAAAALAAATIGIIGVTLAISPATKTNAAAASPAASTAVVERGSLSDTVTQLGTLTYRASDDGSPFSVINESGGIYTQLPTGGDEVGCGHVLYRVNDLPVVLLCGSTPVYRALSLGDRGPDVAELNSNLVQLGYASRAQLAPSSADFSLATATGLEKLQSRLGEEQTGSLDFGRAVFLPESLRISQVTGELGGSAQQGARVLYATSDTPQVQVSLDPAQQDTVSRGDPAAITLPDNTIAAAKVDRVSLVAQVSSAQNGNDGTVTIPAYLSLDSPEQARGLDRAPVEVAITTGRVADRLNVPVTAVVAKTGGGFAVEVVRAGGARELVGVKLGLIDSEAGRVAVEGGLREGDHVVVPSP